MKNRKFEEYFCQYKNLVIRIVMNKTGDYQTAQEICQQVFIAFYKNMDKIDPEIVKAWLIRTTQNLIIDYYRKASNKREIAVDTSISESGNVLIEGDVHLCEENLYNRELIGRIFREVRAVNEQWYEVLMLHCVEGLSYAEMAAKLNIQESVLRARMYRARIFIKEKFGEEYLSKM